MRAILFAALAGIFQINPAAGSTGSPPRSAVTSSLPRAVVVVEPTRLPRSFPGGTIHIEFALDRSGRPHSIRLGAVRDRQLAEQVVKAFSQWQFEAAVECASVQGQRFILPLAIKPQD